MANPALIPGAEQELLRCFSPVFHMARSATCDVELGGKTIKQGDRVALLYGAENHDPEGFENPHLLDIHRENASK